MMTDRELQKALHQLHLEDAQAQALSASMPMLDDAAKQRIMAQCNDKMDLTSAKTDGAEVSGVGQLTWMQRYRPILTAAACILMVCGIGTAVALHGRTPDSPPIAPITQIPTVAETAVHTTEDATETTQTSEAAETSAGTTTSSTTQTIMQTSVVTETTIMTDTQPETVTETSQEVCSVPLQTEALTFRTQTIEEPYPDYADANRIELAYPLANETSAQANAINTLIQERVQAMLSYCQNAADALREEALQYGYDDLYQNASCSLHVSDYEITRNDADYLSIVWHGEYFLSSAAHPNLFAQGLVIDKNTMTMVTLSDLYEMTPEFYEVIQNEASARTAAALVQKFGGTEADYANAAPSIYEFVLPMAGETIIDSHMFALTDSGIIVDAIILHVFGDYVEIHIPFEAIENFRK